MNRTLSLAAAALLVLLPLAAPAHAAGNCKDSVTASGKASLTKVPGAYLSSLAAWRAAAQDRYGVEFRPWRRAIDKNIDCAKGVKDGKSGWICTRTARPCDGGIAKIIGGIKKNDITLPDGPALERGSKGDRVRILQEILVESGYKLAVDGNFGRGTRDAVIDFQKKEGIEADGVVGAATRERLNS